MLFLTSVNTRGLFLLRFLPNRAALRHGRHNVNKSDILMQKRQRPSGELTVNHLVGTWFRAYIDAFNEPYLSLTLAPHEQVLQQGRAIREALGCVIDYAVQTLTSLTVGRADIVDCELATYRSHPMGPIRVDVSLEEGGLGMALYHAQVFARQSPKEILIAEAFGTLQLQVKTKQSTVVSLLEHRS
jgi:hypothetical protein